MLLIRKRGESAWHAPKVTVYENERALQMLLLQSPDLLPGPRHEAMVMVDEMAVAAGYIDVVGVDPEGAITLAECKLKANPEIRRQVIGQVFAYAASLWRMSYDEFDRAFAARAHKSLALSIAMIGGEDWDEEAFRVRVAENLAQGRFRLVIAVDQITDELKETVLYLNAHTLPEVQILALELRYIGDEGVEILVPVTYGEESAQARAGGLGLRGSWDEQSLFTDLEKCCTPEGVSAVRNLLAYLRTRDVQLLWGRGATASVTARLPVRGRAVSAIAIGTWAPRRGGVWAINFDTLIRNEAPREILERVVARLREISGVARKYSGLEQADFNVRPSLSINETLTQPGALETVESALDELMGIASE